MIGRTRPRHVVSQAALSLVRFAALVLVALPAGAFLGADMTISSRLLELRRGRRGARLHDRRRARGIEDATSVQVTDVLASNLDLDTATGWSDRRARIGSRVVPDVTDAGSAAASRREAASSAPRVGDGDRCSPRVSAGRSHLPRHAHPEQAGFSVRETTHRVHHLVLPIPVAR
jgi:hypothetical protein